MADLPFPSVIGLKDGCHAPCLTAAFSHAHLIATKNSSPDGLDKRFTEGKRNQVNI